MDQKEWEAFQKEWGYTDEEIEELKKHPQYEMMYKARHRLRNSRITATVTRAENCTKHKVEDKFVFSPFGRLITEESASQPSVFVISHLLVPLNQIFTEIVLEMAKSGQLPDVIAIDTGGFGSLQMKIDVEIRD